MLATILLNLTGSRMLNYYSTRMVSSMWLLKDGKRVEIQFMNAFFVRLSLLLNFDCGVGGEDSEVFDSGVWVSRAKSSMECRHIHISIGAKLIPKLK